MPLNYLRALSPLAFKLNPGVFQPRTAAAERQFNDHVKPAFFPPFLDFLFPANRTRVCMYVCVRRRPNSAYAHEDKSRDRRGLIEAHLRLFLPLLLSFFADFSG